MRVPSTFIAWSNENKSCMRVDKREFTWMFSQLSLLDQTRTRVARATLYMKVFSAFVTWSNENKNYIRVEKREFTREFFQLSLLDQTRTRVTWENWQFSAFIAWSNENKSYTRELTSESLHESFLSFHCLIKWEQESHERVDNSQLSLLDQTRTRVTRES